MADLVDVGGEARLLQLWAREKRVEATFVLAGRGCDSKEVEFELEDAQAVLLLQSANVLRQPGVLVRACEAVRRKLPIVCVNLAGKAYDFDGAVALLGSLERELTLPDFFELESYLGSRQLSLDSLSRTLARSVPTIIAIPLDTAGSAAQVDAAILEIDRKLKRVQEPVRTSSRTSFRNEEKYSARKTIARIEPSM